MTEHIVVDGSNLATEGRQMPSLAQLEDAVSEVRREMPDAIVTVVVDATFAHRIDPSELERFEQGSLAGTYVHPPAGAVGRGDAFLLRIAERVDGIVCSNDSFQEFHGEHPWLFERGRLLGAMPVPGVGWIFVPRTPVRGAKSRVAVRDSSRARAKVEKAIAAATKEAVEPAEPTPRAPGATAPQRAAQAVNDPLTFIAFIAEHHPGEEIDARVDSFTSHGAVAIFDEVRCYIPLSGLGDPAPKSAREVLRKGETRTFVVTALDPHRRGVELALPGAAVSGRPSEETVAAEVRMGRAASRRSHSSGPSRPARPARTDRGAGEPSPPPRRRRAPVSASADPERPPAAARTGRARASAPARSEDAPEVTPPATERPRRGLARFRTRARDGAAGEPGHG